MITSTEAQHQSNIVYHPGPGQVGFSTASVTELLVSALARHFRPWAGGWPPTRGVPIRPPSNVQVQDDTTTPWVLVVFCTLPQVF